MTWFIGLMLACSTSSPTDLTPETAAAIANEIAASPARADEILSSHGTDRDAFEAALFDIAADAAKSKAYVAARR